MQPRRKSRRSGGARQGATGRRSRSLHLGHRGGGEVALWIAFAAQVEVILPGPKKAAAVEVSLDPPDRMLQHIAHLAGLQMTQAARYPRRSG